MRGVCWQGWTSIRYCNGMPQKDTLDNQRTPVCFRILSSALTSVSIFSVSCYCLVSISVVSHLGSDEKVLLEGDGRVHAILDTAGHLNTITSYRYGGLKKSRYGRMVYVVMWSTALVARK